MTAVKTADDRHPLSVADPEIRPPRRWLPSKVWIIPALAALIGLSLVVGVLRDRGPTITVSFATAEGIEAGKTKVKFKDVDVGEVKAVHLAEDRSHVLVTIDLVREATSFAAADSRFWVARPRLAGSGVSGLDTLLSGAYIGVDAGQSTERRDRFAGLETPPVVASDIPGRRFRLITGDIGSLDVGSPVYFRRIPVGHVEGFALDPDGHNLSLNVFVKSPYDRFVTPVTRFWHASGVDLRLDASGIKLNTQSLATILMGGVAFETPVGAQHDLPASEGSQFALAADHSEALKIPDGESIPMVLRFRQSVRGLTIGAPVDFRGVELGQVRAIELTYEQAAGDFAPMVTIDLYPDRLSSAVFSRPEGQTRRQRSQLLADLIRRGLRGQLRTGSLLTGQLFVALDFFPTAPSVRFDPAADPVELPTVPGDFQELYQQVQEIMKKLDKIPFDTLGQDAHRMMVSLDATLRRMDTVMQRADSQVLPELRDSLREMRASMDSLRESSAADAPLQQDTRQVLRGVAEATRSLKRLTDTLERQPESLLRGRKDQTQ